jgi:hypothetical protein
LPDRINAKNAGGRELVGQRGEFPDETQTIARVWWKQAGAVATASYHQTRTWICRLAENPEMVEPSGIEPLTSTMPL